MIKSAKTLILTPNKLEMCGMYQLAKDLAKEFNADIMTKDTFDYYDFENIYDECITFLYPMHKIGKELKRRYGLKWICYDQKIPPINKIYFPNFWRRQAMRYIAWRNNITMQGADEYWDVTEREQKPRWNEKSKIKSNLPPDYAIYLGRKTDYKNFIWLKKTMAECKINFVWSDNESDEQIHSFLSYAKMLVTASLWEGYGRIVMEACALNIPVVCYDVGTHRFNMEKYNNKGICVPLDINNLEKSEKLFKEAVIKVWQQ